MMAEAARSNIAMALEQFISYDEKRAEEITRMEDRLDHFTDRADNYLIDLSQNIETEKDNRHRNMLMQSIRDIERIGDYATNFDEMAKEMHEKELGFSEIAQKELDVLRGAVLEILRLTVETLEKDSEAAAGRI